MTTADKLDLAVKVAPCFRDKFDFSRDEDYEKMAQMAFNLVNALIMEGEARAKREGKTHG